MPEAKRPDPKRRSPASRPGRPGPAGDPGRGRPRVTARREQRATEPAPDAESTPDAIRRSIAASAELLSEQRFSSTARRAAVLAAVVCVLTLTIAGPVRTYFAQRTEMKQLKATEEQLRAQIAELEQQQVKLGDPVFIAAQARERLGFVMPGEIPYQVQLPPDAAVPGAADDAEPAIGQPQGPWYSALWHTIADVGHGVSPPTAPAPPEPAPGVPPTPAPPPAPGG